MAQIQYTDIGGGKAICTFTAPENLTAHCYARFQGKMINDHQQSAQLDGKINGASLPPKTDSDFGQYDLKQDVSLPLTAGTTLTFETTRTNHSAVTTAFEMYIEF